MLTFPETLLDKPEEHSARAIALALLADLQKENDRHLTAPDKESLHDVRVALRRLRSWLRAQRPLLAASVTKKSENTLRRIAQSSNPSRDAEVFIEWLDDVADAMPTEAEGAAEYLRRDLALVREPSSTDAAKLTAKFNRIMATLGDRLPMYSLDYDVRTGATGHTFATGMAVSLRQHAHTLRRRMAKLTEGSSADDAHRARIAGKRLRYLIEPVAPWIPQGSELIVRLKALQDTLGALHDAHMWMQQLRLALEAQEREEIAVAVDLTGPDPVEANTRNTDASTPDLRAGLMAIVQLVRDHARTAFDAYNKTWSGESAREFFDAVEQAAESLAHRHASEYEIERKYLLSHLPDPRPQGDVMFIEQGYLPGQRLIERLRRVTTNNSVFWYRTVKVGSGITRMELDEPTTREVFEAMWPLTEGRRVTKRRHEIRHGDMIWQIDEFTDRELVLAEVELTDAGEVPELPPWLASCFVREVTEESAYVNAQLAK